MQQTIGKKQNLFSINSIIHKIKQQDVIVKTFDFIKSKKKTKEKNWKLNISMTDTLFWAMMVLENLIKKLFSVYNL